MEPLFTTRLSARAVLWERLLGAAAGLALAVFSFTFHLWPGLMLLIAALLMGGVLLHSWIRQRLAVYRLFPDRLEVERGILTRRIDNLELFRVRDVSLRQGVLGRLLDIGDVTVLSTDTSTPEVCLQGVDDPRGLYQQLRECISRSRAQHRTLIVEDADQSAEQLLRASEGEA